MDIVLEYSLDGGVTWEHGRTVPAWVQQDREAMRAQREAVRENVRAQFGNVESISLRALSEDDPRGALNQPPVLPPTPVIFHPGQELARRVYEAVGQAGDNEEKIQRIQALVEQIEAEAAR